jgi:hypothetical protein
MNVASTQRDSFRQLRETIGHAPQAFARILVLERAADECRDELVLSLRVIVFLGPNQKTVSTDLAMALQARGTNGQHVKISAGARCHRLRARSAPMAGSS